jgi:HEAT repeat protein
VRVKAADCLGAIHTDEAFTALLDSCMQEDERVRENVFQALGGYYRQQSLDSMLKQVAREENPRIATSLLRSLGRYHGPEVNHLLLTKLEESSFQNRMAEAVVEALHQHERTDAEFIEPLYRSVRQRQGDYTASGLSMALETLGRLGHSLAEKQEIRDLLTNYVNDPRRRVQTGALKGLGALGDTMAIPVLNAFTAGEVPAYRRGLARTAEEALKTLRQEKPLVADEVIQLRERITELDKNTLKLQETLEALEKRLDAYGAPNEPSPSVDPNEAES